VARGNWNIFYEDSGGTWVADGTISPPNENLDIGRKTTKIEKKLVTGDIAHMTPEVKYVKEELVFRWLLDNGTIKTKIETYLQDQLHIKIIDSNADEYIGYFTNIRRVWISGTESDEYDIDATFIIKE